MLTQDFYNKLLKKIIFFQLQKEINSILEMKNIPEKRTEFNDEIVKKTWKYQKKYGFQTSKNKGEEFWNNEADAFKHAFGSALMAFRFGQLGSLIGGIYHENQLAINPEKEWNMDSWNNYQGRQIAKQIKKSYNKNLYKLSSEELEDIIARKVIERINNKSLITNLDDKREFNNFLEKKFNTSKLINEQERKYIFFINPESQKNRIFTREELQKLTLKEYKKYEKEINAQLKTIGIPYKNELPKNIKTYTDELMGHWVTIDGNHVFIKDK